MGFWSGVAIGSAVIVFLLLTLFVFAAAKTSGREALEEELVQSSLKKQEEVNKRRAMIRVVS